MNGSEVTLQQKEPRTLFRVQSFLILILIFFQNYKFFTVKVYAVKKKAKDLMEKSRMSLQRLESISMTAYQFGIEYLM